MSELNRTARQLVVERMDAYDNFAACGQITAFVDALSNWYVRRSRDRFWSGDWSDDKSDAYWTLYECLLTTARLVAPFVPFLAEALWQNLAVAGSGGRALASVHLCDYPAGDPAAVDEPLSAEMSLVREIVSLGATLAWSRNSRSPAAGQSRDHPGQPAAPGLDRIAPPLIREELNVKQVEFVARADQYISYTVLPDLKKLGPRLGKRLPELKKALAAADAVRLLADLELTAKSR